MNKFDYYLHDCLIQGWKNVGWALAAWKDWMTSNYENYDCFPHYTQEDKEQAVRLDFWDSLEDDIIDYEALSYLRFVVQDLDKITTEEEWDDWKTRNGVVPMTQEWVDRITELVDGVTFDKEEI
ncbi:hypothetical cyanophage protein [Synechococcus phage S-CRM01]|uniref:hypothetical cyanophage protein n=1 Tax=Synechococcus phage S-CRM01 TaxID=1026955 RepID=UPI000209E39E|nr:hypothetical cyanophage protein [Synechococcus phage S-CRM01]AEC53044.1 hypothetical cyanophage protein [Synechococcus phage S-CRM01]